MLKQYRNYSSAAGVAEGYVDSNFTVDLMQISIWTCYVFTDSMKAIIKESRPSIDFYSPATAIRYVAAAEVVKKGPWLKTF